MITSEIKVNSDLIGHIYCVNKKEIKQEDCYVYQGKFYRIGEGAIEITFSIKHKRKDGFEKLMLLIWKKINKELKK